MNSERLLKLADHLDTVPPDQFDMRKWSSECGTTACAMGHAVTIFPGEGLSLVDGFAVRVLQFVVPGHGMICYTDETHNHIGFTGTAKFMDISLEEAKQLFSAEGFKVGGVRVDKRGDPKKVAQKIRQFVKEKQDQEFNKITQNTQLELQPELACR